MNNEIEMFRREMFNYQVYLEMVYADHGVTDFNHVEMMNNDGFYNNPNGIFGYVPFETQVFKFMADIETKYAIINNNITGDDACAKEAYKHNLELRNRMKEITGSYPEDTIILYKHKEAH